MPERKPAINYTSRDFTTIKSDLVNYARRYYPDSFKDFTVNSFGSLMLDTVSYVGDILSFYLDYQVNETFLSTATDYDNVLKISRQLGLKPNLAPASFGFLTFFILVPATNNGGPDFDYAPILKSNSQFRSAGGKTFTLLEDVNFKDSQSNEIVVGEVDNDTGVPISFAVRARGQAISGELAVHQARIGEFAKFQKIEVPGQNITEIVSVIDSDGNPYFEVDYLSQNTIYVPVINSGEDSSTVPNILKPVAVPRRFTVIQERDSVFLQFGFGKNEGVEEVLDPSNILTKTHGKNYITDDSFDPASLIKTDSLGISPNNTLLTIVYRINDSTATNTGIGTITSVVDPIFSFESQTSLNASSVSSVRNSLEVINEEPFVGGDALPTSDELKQRAYGVYSMQNRIVTKEDFITAAYNMPPSFGSIKKVNVYQDSDSFNQRNINLFVLSQDNLGNLQKANSTVKSNLKTYLSRLKMMNDTIDILDANIINLQINYKVVGFSDASKYSVLDSAKESLANFFQSRKNFDIGEPFSITDVFSVLKNSPLVLDVLEVDVTVQSGPDYSSSNFSTILNKTRDGRKINCPPDSIFEIKFPNTDIVGTIQ
tara:strand:- start:8975 stop:10771 length:1797 start_codon:yes stop_codon:yes gene_type:complete